MDKETGITFGIGFLTGMRGTPLWMTALIAILIEGISREVSRQNPELLPGYRPREPERIAKDLTVGVIGWWVGKEIERK